MVVSDQMEEVLGPKESKEEDPFGLACTLECFVEYEEVFRMIDDLPTIVLANQSVQEKAYERFSFILSQYIEQPHLVDSHIDDILQRFVNIVRSPSSSMALKHLAFKYMFVVVNVRGYKVIVRHLPHEVADFEPVLQLLESQDPADTETWTTRYVLLLWLSIIVMIPFHMSRFDGFTDGETAEKPPVMLRVMNLIKTYAVGWDKCRDAAAFLSYKFLTRQDVKEQYLSSFLDWAMELSLSPESNIFTKHGTLACIAVILKHGKREDLLPHVPKLLQWITNAEFRTNCGSNVLKLVYKIIQRIGLTFLPPKMAPWRYNRGNRSLTANLMAGDSTNPTTVSNNNNIDESSVAVEVEIADEIEEVIDQLIQGLRSADSIVRWSAAKGIGRVTGRLPKELADEVVGSVLELFSPREGDGAWHGGCLALAELGRRGLLLPERLPQVVPVVLKSLVYDEPRGYSSVGSHIRDAACYVCWSFARAYDQKDLAPFVNSIASMLLVVTCFDKEINCRRAASAAFQENVGRQGAFPHGIDILTTADFFAVSIRNNAYLNISSFIAQYEEYTLSLINHLLERKVDHWEGPIRELTAKSLHNLTEKATDFMVEKALPALFEKAKSIDLNSRHGSVLAIGEILHALSIISKKDDRKVESLLTNDTINQSKDLIGFYKERFYFRGLGGELMKQACSHFIEKCSLASMPFHKSPVLTEWLSLLNDSLSYEVQQIRTAAITALPVFLQEYSSDTPIENHSLVMNYIELILSTNMEHTRMGHVLALGALPKFILQPDLQIVINSIIEAIQIHANTVKWAESRRDGVKALTSIVLTMQSEIGGILTDELLLKIFETFLEGLKDYTQDKRGDIGAWMREASMTGLQTLTHLLAEKRPLLLNEDLVGRILSGIAQQAVEKIDRTRAIAGKVFYSFLYNSHPVPNILNIDELHEIFPQNECDEINWNSAACTFPKFVQLIKLPQYTYYLLMGIVCSIGGLTETLVKNSSHALFEYMQKEMKEKGMEEIIRICDTIYQIFFNHQKNDRITVPMFRFIVKLFDSGCINAIIAESSKSDFARKTLKLIQLEIAGCKDIYKLIDGINVLCQFIEVKGDVCETALIQLSILLCHRQPYVRKSTATKLYESLLCKAENSNIKEENCDQVMEMLSNTNWEESVEQIKPIRNELCGLMGIRVPVSKKKT